MHRRRGKLKSLVVERIDAVRKLGVEGATAVENALLVAAFGIALIVGVNLVYSAMVVAYGGTADEVSASETLPPPPPPPPVPVDTDGDGVPDAQDLCPTAAGPALNNGCPPPPPLDTDGDGVPDDDDLCPTVSGPASNSGCPPPPPPGSIDKSVKKGTSITSNVFTDLGISPPGTVTVWTVSPGSDSPTTFSSTSGGGYTWVAPSGNGKTITVTFTYMKDGVTVTGNTLEIVTTN